MAEDMVKQQVFDALPDTETCQRRSVDNCLVEIAKIRQSKLCAACGPSFEDEIDLAYRMISNIQKSQSPSALTVLKMSQWSRQLMGRCAHFLTLLVPVDPTNPKSSVQMISGHAALNELWKQFLAKPEQERTLDDAAPFRKFSWMLLAEQSNLVESLVNSGIAAYQATFLQKSICDASTPGDHTTDVYQARGASAAGSSGDDKALFVTRDFVSSAAPGMKSKADSLAESKARLLKMFKK